MCSSVSDDVAPEQFIHWIWFPLCTLASRLSTTDKRAQGDSRVDIACSPCGAVLCQQRFDRCSIGNFPSPDPASQQTFKATAGQSTAEQRQGIQRHPSQTSGAMLTRCHRPSMTSPQLESGCLNPPSYHAPADVRIDIPATVTPLQSDAQPSSAMRVSPSNDLLETGHWVPTAMRTPQATSRPAIVGGGLDQTPGLASASALTRLATALTGGAAHESVQLAIQRERDESTIHLWGNAVSDALVLDPAGNSDWPDSDLPAGAHDPMVARPQRRLKFTGHGSTDGRTSTQKAARTLISMLSFGQEKEPAPLYDLPSV